MASHLPADPKTSGAQPTWVVGPPVAPESRIGKLIEGEYRIQSILGQGELGVSYQAHNARLKRSFAVLMLDRQLLPTHEMMLAVRADLRRAQALGDLGMLPIKQVTDDDGIPGFATELLEGETLRQRLGRGPLPPDRALSLVVQVGQALEAAHASGLVHGDLRPESIFLVRPGAKSRYAGRAVLMKHSLRHLRRRPVGFDDSLPIGKLMYRPPEQVAGEVLEADVSGDVFVLGGILHECLTGQPAFGGEDVEAVLDHLAGPPALLSPGPGLSPPLAEALNVVIAGACARDPQARIPTIAELLRALRQVASGAGIALTDVVSDNVQAPRGRISRIFQRLSGAFPVITPPKRPEAQGLAAQPGAAEPNAPRKPVEAPPNASLAPLPRVLADPASSPGPSAESNPADRRPEARAAEGKPTEGTPRAAPPEPAHAAPAADRPVAPAGTQVPAAAPTPVAAPAAEAPAAATPAAPEPAAPEGAAAPVAPTSAAALAPASPEPPGPRGPDSAVPEPTPAAPASADRRTQLGISPASIANQATQPPKPREAVDLSGDPRPQSQRPTLALSRLGRDPDQLSPAARRLTQQTPLSERSTRQLRARDITQLVAAVQAGRLDPAQAVELAREPEEIQLDDRDLQQVPRRPPPQPTAPMHLPAPTVHHPSSLQRFLLRHQEVVAALIGATTILLLGLLLLRCRGG